MAIALLLLLLLFLAGFLNLFYYLPSKKLYAWLQSLFFDNRKPSVAAKEVVMATSQVSKQLEKKNYHHNSEKRAELKSVFATFDKNGDGFITKQELGNSLKNIRIFMTEKEVEEMVVKVDSNGDGLIDFEEFCELCDSLAMSSDQEGENSLRDDNGSAVNEDGDLKEAFDVFDRDKDGLISVEELGLVLSSLGLKEGRRVEDCKEMIKKVDMDGDGMVNFDEFKKMMRSGSCAKLISAF